MAQCRLGLLLGLEAYEAKLSELAVFGELQAAVSQCTKGSKQLSEPLLLHLGRKGHSEEGAWGPQREGIDELET